MLRSFIHRSFHLLLGKIAQTSQPYITYSSGKPTGKRCINCLSKQKDNVLHHVVCTTLLT